MEQLKAKRPRESGSVRVCNGGMVTHYLDDFFFVVYIVCSSTLECVQSTCKTIGVPLAPAKTVYPCHEITYLGLKINSYTQQITAPYDKVVGAMGKLCYEVSSYI